MSYDSLDFEDVEVPNAGWAKWDEVGRTYIGEFASYNVNGGRTYDGDPCDELVLIVGGENLRVTLDKGALRDAVQAANATHGDVVRIERTDDAESKSGRTYTTYKVSVARGAASASTADKDEPAGF